jgi:hypothetical protein
VYVSIVRLWDVSVQLLLRYQTQFRMDARVLLEAERGYNAEFAKTFNELIDKYLTSFTQEVRPVLFSATRLVV